MLSSDDIVVCTVVVLVTGLGREGCPADGISTKMFRVRRGFDKHFLLSPNSSEYCSAKIWKQRAKASGDVKFLPSSLTQQPGPKRRGSGT
jgi:hypothetical protein